ncbi:MAG: 3-deoxy-manno-octulosonate cytidylyltransferase [Alphaproteobacteria bacterium]
MKPIIIIPARMASTRLPGKPLAEIGGKPMIVQVADRAREADCGPVLVAAAEAEIADAARDHGVDAVLTDPDLPSGSDRVWQALGLRDSDGVYDTIINVQGDLPTLDPGDVRAALAPMRASTPDSQVDIATLATEITRAEERENPNVVKAVIADNGRALYFTRATAPYGEGPLYHHIGLYTYRRAALEKFVGLPPSPLEMREKLEQLRALEAGMRVDVALVSSVPLGVDTPEDLARARALLKG